ncbi:lipase 1-like [Ostrinia nubilalis]|uniref:lipase 1-like n=1 Tax=Ostrinia nubilalis TaxID=29057 RepID=UPI0030824075
MKRIWILLVLNLMQSKTIVTQSSNDTSLESIPEDGKLNFSELAVKYGHKCDEHQVVTEDGYILTVFNIKGNKNKPVFLMHGIIDNCDTFIVRGNTSLAITLANQGYDVWAGNNRGNKYSKRHVTLDPDADKKSFWNYSQHELGVYDLPAMIDLVLNQTGQTGLQAIGHSQGNSIFYILTAEKPEYNDKIKLMIALAPICYLHHVKETVQVIIDVWPVISPALQLSGTYELLTRDSALVKAIEALCTRKLIGYAICATAVFAIAGPDKEELEPEFLPILFGHYPDVATIKNGNHLVQIADKKRFTKYDYGLLSNYKVYGSAKAPNYLLENVRIPVALLVGQNDYLSTVKDVALLRKNLPNVVYYHEMQRPKTNHADFVWGKNMKDYLFPLVLELLQKYQ